MHHPRALGGKLAGKPQHIGNEVLRRPSQRLDDLRGHQGAAHLLELRRRCCLVHGVTGWRDSSGQLGEKEIELGAFAEPQAQESHRALEPSRQAFEDIYELAFGAAPDQGGIGVQDRAGRERLGLE